MTQRAQEQIFGLEVHVIEARFYPQTPNVGSNYSAILLHQNTRFQTVVFPVKDSQIDFRSSKTFMVEHPHHVYQRSSQPFLKILLIPTSTHTIFEASVGPKSVGSLFEMAVETDRKEKKTNRIFSFPLMTRGRLITGELKLSFIIWRGGEQIDVVKSRIISSSRNKYQAGLQRKRVCSNDGQRYFHPCVSRKVPVSLISLEQYEVEKRSHFASSQNLHANLQHREQNHKSMRGSSSQSASQVQSAQEHQRQEFSQHQNYPADLGLKIKKSNSNKNSQIDVQRPSTDELNDLPEDFRPLFQKINQINLKYAPLEKIPSQEELSQQGSQTQKQNSDESFYSLNSDFDAEPAGDNNPLDNAEKLLRELNLYKLGKKLVDNKERVANST